MLAIIEIKRKPYEVVRVETLKGLIKAKKGRHAALYHRLGVDATLTIREPGASTLTLAFRRPDGTFYHAQNEL